MPDIAATAAKAFRTLRDKSVGTRQGQLTIAGGGVGAVAATVLGVSSVGVAGAFGAIPVAGVLLVAIPGALVGNWIGQELEKRDLRKQLEEAKKAAGPTADAT
jgi:uncharacterized protein YqgC (DUF456 family)